MKYLKNKIRNKIYSMTYNEPLFFFFLFIRSEHQKNVRSTFFPFRIPKKQNDEEIEIRFFFFNIMILTLVKSK